MALLFLKEQQILKLSCAANYNGALCVIFEKKQQHLKLSSVANYRWPFIGVGQYDIVVYEVL